MKTAVPPSRSKSDKLIVLAKAAGYYANKDGVIFSPEGRPLKGGTAKSGHKNFLPCVCPRAQRSSVLQHRFVAYYFLGDDVFNWPLVRHKNDIPSDNRINNLALGTYKENRADIPTETLSAIGKANVGGLIERSRKLSNFDIHALRAKRKFTGASYKKLGDLFGVTTMTAYRAINKQCWSNI